MTSQLTPFNFDDSLIRSTVIDGKPWFVARDVATALGYSNPMEAVRYHCKGVSETLTPTSGGEQTVKVIAQGDVLRLITRSRLPAAERFEAWVFDEMLPELLSKGSYSLAGQAEKQRLDDVRAGLRLRGEVERLIDKAKRERNPELRATLHAALVESCAAASLPAPSLDALGGPDLAERSRLDAFWAAVSELMATGEDINHSHDPARLAISLPHLQRLAEKHRVKLPKPSHIRRCLRTSEVPMFIDYRTVHSALFGGSVKCWVFAQEDSGALSSQGN